MGFYPNADCITGANGMGEETARAFAVEGYDPLTRNETKAPAHSVPGHLSQLLI
jgi:hypothetical protein